MNPFWNRHSKEDVNSEFPQNFQRSKRKTHVFLWFTLMLLAILVFDLWMLEASGWLIAGNGATMVASIWLVLAKMR